MWAGGIKGGWGGGGGGLSQVVRVRVGSCVETGEVEREVSLHHPSQESSACCFGKKVMINAKVTAIP